RGRPIPVCLESFVRLQHGDRGLDLFGFGATIRKDENGHALVRPIHDQNLPVLCPNTRTGRSSSDTRLCTSIADTITWIRRGARFPLTVYPRTTGGESNP